MATNRDDHDGKPTDRIDDIDLNILKILQADGRTALSEIARRLDMGTATIHERTKSLEEEGYIREYRAMLDPELLDINEVAFLQICTEAGARLRPLSLYRTVDGAPQDTTMKLPEGPTAWDNIADHFIACILEGVACHAPLRHGLIVQEMMEGLLESARDGCEVRFA